jgi:glycosyltransferase involved in cell wall biosynthesis
VTAVSRASPSDGRVRVVEVSNARHAWGAEGAIMALAPPLAERGVDLVLASPPGSELAAGWVGLGLPHVPLPLAARRGIRAADGVGGPPVGQVVRELGASVASVRRIVGAARHGDVVTSASLWTHLDCAVAGRLVHRPVVLDLHDIVRPGLGRSVLTVAVRLASASLSISGAVAECVGSAARDRVRIMAPAVDLTRFSPGPADPDVRARLTSSPSDPVVGIVGRIDPEKGVDAVVRAVAALRGPAGRAHLAVVGARGLDAGAYLEVVRADAGRLLGDRVRFVGRVEDVPSVLRALDVVVNASVAEPFGLSILEAQACGVPVVATRAGGVTDFLTDEENALLVPVGDTDAMASALARLLDPDSDLAARLARRGRVDAEAAHGVDTFADELAALYHRLARRPRAPHGVEEAGEDGA